MTCCTHPPNYSTSTWSAHVAFACFFCKSLLSGRGEHEEGWGRPPRAFRLDDGSLVRHGRPCSSWPLPFTCSGSTSIFKLLKSNCQFVITSWGINMDKELSGGNYVCACSFGSFPVLSWTIIPCNSVWLMSDNADEKKGWWLWCYHGIVSISFALAGAY